MDFVNEETAREFEFWRRQLDMDTPQSQYVTLSMDDVLAAHFALVDHFATDGLLLGGVGPRDVGLLESTVARQFSGFGKHDKWDNQYQIIGTLFFGLIRNHPFHDANKRTALLSLIIHLQKVKKVLKLSDQELEDFTVDVAQRALERHRQPKNRSKQLRGVDEEIAFIARWIRRNSRNLDNEYREISYERLQTILANYGYYLANPKGNYIDVVRAKGRARRLMSFLRLGESDDRVRKIGFHSWKGIVPKRVMKEVREATGLTYKNGVDSQVFYNIEDPIRYLIGRYEVPLRNLADR